MAVALALRLAEADAVDDRRVVQLVADDRVFLAEQRKERLGGVLSVLYVIFTEGSTATSGKDLLRPDLAYEAIRLARMLAALLPDEPEVSGLLALFELTAARFPARTGPDGEAVLLEDQDRRRWDRSAIRRGLAATVYTQLADVEEEVNGLVTYDRRFVKVPEATMRAINDRMRDAAAAAFRKDHA